MLQIIPSPDTIPVHWLWFQVLLTFTFILHLIFMNLILGGSLLTIWEIIKGKTISSESKNIPTLIALTINLGVPPLLFVQVLFGNFFYSSSTMMAVYWILVIPILILAYYGAYIFAKKVDKKPLLAKVSLVVSSLFMLYVGFMFVNNSTMSIQPETWNRYLGNQRGTLLNLGDASLWPRFLHFIISAVAIAALGKSIWAKFFLKANAEEKKEKTKSNLQLFGWATAIQFAVGTWFWLAMPSEVTKTFMGGSLIPTLFMVIVWISAGLIVYFALKGKLINALIQGVLQIVIMAIVREFTRSSYLKDIFAPSQLHNVSQASSLVVFLLVFIIGLLSIYFMYHLTVNSKTNKS